MRLGADVNLWQPSPRFTFACRAEDQATWAHWQRQIESEEQERRAWLAEFVTAVLADDLLY